MGFGDATRQASSFLLDKYKAARRFLNDVSQAELMTEEATNSDPRSPDARTMMKIAAAAFNSEDYWRIINVLHRRFQVVNFKEWRQSYKSMVLLDFLITHGPEGMAQEFLCDVDVIQELGTFKHVDGKGFDWGIKVEKISERLSKLLCNEGLLVEARQKAMELSGGRIEGFGNSTSTSSYSSSSSSSSSSPPASSSSANSSRTSSFSSNSSNDSVISSWNENIKSPPPPPNTSSFRFRGSTRGVVDLQDGLLLDPKNEAMDDDKDYYWGCKSSTGKGGANLWSFSQVAKVVQKKMDRQMSLGF